MVTIEKYRAGWHPGTNRGQILVHFSTGTNKKINFENPAEFTAVLQVLATAEKVVVDKAGTIWTGTEDVDGESDGFLTRSS